MQDGDQKESSFEGEISAYRHLPDHDYLNELCATFVVGYDYMLLFPWAEGGNLQALWKESPCAWYKSKNKSSRNFIKWIAQQCHGLVSALHAIQKVLIETAPATGDEDKERFGIHYDITPENILHFTDEKNPESLGTLKIADFGLTRFHRFGSRTQPIKGSNHHVSPTYRSPEHEVIPGYETNAIMSRKIDIWALGCVFSELMAWAVRGSDGLEEYRTHRVKDDTYTGAIRRSMSWGEDNFFRIHVNENNAITLIKSAVQCKTIKHQPEFTVKKSVLKVSTRIPMISHSSSILFVIVGKSLRGYQCIESLIRDTRCGERSSFTEDFLTIIREEMLCIKRESRGSASELKGRLATCQAETMESYWSFIDEEVSYV
jgi:serine/threonine protein kinase